MEEGSRTLHPRCSSSAPVADPEPEDCFTDELEDSVRCVVRHIANAVLLPEHLKDSYLEKLKRAAAADSEYGNLVTAVKNGFPTDRRKAKVLFDR